MTTQLSFLASVAPTSHPIACLRESAAQRVAYNSSSASLAELLATMIGGPGASDTAQRLLGRFGSAFQLARASATDLQGTEGVGFTTAARIKAALALSQKLLEPEEERPVIKSPADAAALLSPRMAALEQEYLFVLLLDTRNRILGMPIEVYHGSLNTSLIRSGEVFRDAVKANAAGLIVAHNHPSGDPSPSPEDVAVTRTLRETGKVLDIELLDHLIIGHPHWVSLKERCLGFA